MAKPRKNFKFSYTGLVSRLLLSILKQFSIFVKSLYIDSIYSSSFSESIPNLGNTL